MKLKSLEIYVVGNPEPCWGGKYFVFVKLITNTNLFGYGEVYSASISPNAMKNIIEDITRDSIGVLS